MKYVNAVVLILLTLALSACSMSGNITDLTVRNTTMSVGQLTGIVSGGVVQSTSGGYQVSATVGEPYATIVNTSGGGYTMFSSLSGNMASSAILQNIQ